MLRLDGKVVFMSGAGSVGDDPDAKVWGNGKATAVLLARQGAKIYGTDVRLEAADVTRRIIEAEGGTCVTRAVDMTKAKEVEAAVVSSRPLRLEIGIPERVGRRAVAFDEPARLDARAEL